MTADQPTLADIEFGDPSDSEVEPDRDRGRDDRTADGEDDESWLALAALVLDAARTDPRATAGLLASEAGARIRVWARAGSDWLADHYADASERRTRFYQGVVALGLVVAWLTGQSGLVTAVRLPAVLVALGPFVWFADQSERWDRLGEMLALMAAAVLTAVLAKATVAPHRSVEAFATETPIGRLTGVVGNTALMAALLVGSAAVSWWVLEAYHYRTTNAEERVLADGSGDE